MTDLVIIAGPTAVGKSAVSVELAKRINGSIISADSMQVYRGMDIGTAKLTHEEMGGIPHFLIDVLDPSEDFNIVMFKEMATSAIKDINKSGRIPMIVGGTGFYIQSVLYDIDFPEGDEMTQYRMELAQLIETKGPQYVHDMLKAVDCVAAAKIHPNDHKRVIRALEYNKQTGGLISEHNRAAAEHKSPYNFCYFVLVDDREKIYERINERVDKMIENGLVDEVRDLLGQGLTKENVSMHGLGYKEIIDHLEGRCSLSEAVYAIKRDSRHFAKRQLTWFKREKDVFFINIREREAMLDIMTDELRKRGIIDG